MCAVRILKSISDASAHVCLFAREIEGWKTVEGKMKTACQKKICLICIMCKCECVCACGFIRLPLISRLTGFAPAEDFFSDTQKSVTTTFLSVSVCQIFIDLFFPPFCSSVFFLQLYINLFFTSAWILEQIPFPQKIRFHFS